MFFVPIPPIAATPFSKIVTLSRYKSGTKSLKQNLIRNLIKKFVCSTESVKARTVRVSP